MKCDRLVQLLGGKQKIELLWLGDLSEKEFQYAIINTRENSSNNIFYLCGNPKNHTANEGDDFLQVLGQRNLIKFYYNSTELFTKVFSIASKDSREYIMKYLKKEDFNITDNEMSLAMVEGLLNIKKKKQPKKVVKKTKKIEKKNRRF